MRDASYPLGHTGPPLDVFDVFGGDDDDGGGGLPVWLAPTDEPFLAWFVGMGIYSSCLAL